MRFFPAIRPFPKSYIYWLQEGISGSRSRNTGALVSSCIVRYCPKRVEVTSVNMEELAREGRQFKSWFLVDYCRRANLSQQATRFQPDPLRNHGENAKGALATNTNPTPKKLEGPYEFSE